MSAAEPTPDPLTTLLERQHVAFVLALDEARDSVEYAASEYLRASGVYWGLAALATLNRADRLDRAAVAAFAASCAAPAGTRGFGGYGGHPGHDAHLLYTLSCLQLLALCGRLDLVDVDATARFVRGLQRADGSFAGDEWGEVDTRFSYCALQAAALLGRLGDLDVAAAVAFVARCRNFDGGFGSVPGAESHAGQVFCCVGALAIAGGGALERVLGGGDGGGESGADVLGWWLCERQVDSGGLNGRPEKQSDVCYSWWILSALSILGRVSWIDRSRLADFILACQDPSTPGGGIADRPGNVADVFHTFFGIAGLSLLGRLGTAGESHRPIDPVYALPADLVASLGLPREVLTPLPGA